MTNKEKLFNVGKIVGTHGIKGELKIASITDFPEKRYQKENVLYIENKEVPVTIESVRIHKGNYLLKFMEINNLTEAEKFKGKTLKSIHENDELKENEFYYSDIIGLGVVDNKLGEIGEISEILSPGANDVWVVKSKKYKEVLIPYIPSVILNVDLTKKIVTVDIPEGLID
ncbi:ribosome maturation factor RimM [Companilactobacillus sp. DQM5]|uniref:ribosome maturation factor RimM n=1 Tax=Companilactobacillus sp. DQM5 TaxID=3463359 RepID=UPI00405A1383